MGKRSKRTVDHKIGANNGTSLPWLDNPALMLSVLLGIALAIRLAFLYAFRNDIFSKFLVIDAEFYDQWAQKIAQGDWIGKEVFYQDPLYAYFLAILYKVFGHSLVIVRVVQAVLDVGTIGLLYLLGKCLFDSRTGLVAAAIGAFYGPMVCYTSLLDKTTFTTFLTTLSLALLCLAQNSGSLPGCFLAGLAFGVASLTRGNMVLVGIAIAVWMLINRQDRGNRAFLWKSGSFACGLTLVVGLGTLRNYWVAGDFVPLTANAGLNFDIGNNSGSVGIYMVPPFTHGTPATEFPESKSYAEYKSGKKLEKASEVSRFYLQEGLKSILDNPGGWTLLTVRKIYLMAHGFEVGETYSYYYFRDQYKILWAGILNFAILGPIGIVGGLLLFARRRVSSLHIFSIAYGFSLVLFFISSRYRFPLVIPSILFSSWLLASFVPELKSASRSKAVGLGIFLSTMLFACNWPFAWIKERVMKPTLATPYMIAGFLYLDKLSDPGGAIKELERAVKMHPTSSINYLYLANCYMKLGDDEKSLENFRQVVKFNPANDEAYENMGALFFKHQNYPMAVEMFNAALRYKPYEAVYKSNYELAKSMMVHGRQL